MECGLKKKERNKGRKKLLRANQPQIKELCDIPLLQGTEPSQRMECCQQDCRFA